MKINSLNRKNFTEVVGNIVGNSSILECPTDIIDTDVEIRKLIEVVC